MIFLNQYIATLLRNDKVIYRNHEPQKFAEYSFENKGHFSLKLKQYTHFTSPIRRFVDQYVHKVLINKIFKKIDIPDISVDDINTYDKQLKKITLYWNYLSVSTKIVDGSAYALEFLQFDSKRVEFKLLDYNISINNKLLFVCINNTTIKINNMDYELNKVYILPLYIIHNNTFPNIIIKFI
jgi:exoribonuclease R